MKLFTREELYQLVWSKPMSQIAPELGMTSRGLAKRCALYKIPVPPRGYWRIVHKPPLPDMLDPGPITFSRRAMVASQVSVDPSKPNPLTTGPMWEALQKQKDCPRLWNSFWWSVGINVRACVYFELRWEHIHVRKNGSWYVSGPLLPGVKEMACDVAPVASEALAPYRKEEGRCLVNPDSDRKRHLKWFLEDGIHGSWFYTVGELRAWAEAPAPKML